VQKNPHCEKIDAQTRRFSMRLVNVIAVAFSVFAFHASANNVSAILEESKLEINLEDIQDVFDIEANGTRQCSGSSGNCTLSFTCPSTQNCVYDFVQCRGSCY